MFSEIHTGMWYALWPTT